jgi:hypothetical protein
MAGTGPAMTTSKALKTENTKIPAAATCRTAKSQRRAR